MSCIATDTAANGCSRHIFPGHINYVWPVSFCDDGLHPAPVVTSAFIAHVTGFEIEAAGALASRGRLPVLIVRAEVHAGETVAGLAVQLKLRRGRIFEIPGITDLR
jgi:hypothetical protein